MKVALALFTAGLACSAHAWPVDQSLEVAAGSERFARAPDVAWAQSANPKVATVETFESGEVLVTGRSPGQTELLLYAQGKLAAWRVRVVQGPSAPRLGEGELVFAQKACPGLKDSPGLEQEALVVEVKSEGCRQALLSLLKTDRYLARQLSITFSGDVLQAQLAALQKRLPKGVLARYVGAGLELTGAATVEGHRGALWEAFRESAGRVALDDRVRLPEPPALDGG